MKKILYIVSTLKNSGPTNQLSYIVKYLDKNKFEAVVLTLSPEPKNGSMKSYFTDTLKVKVDSLNLSRLQGLLFARHNVYKYIKKNCIDLVHSQGIRADSIMSGIDIPRVATLRNYPYYDYPMTYGKIKGAIMAYKHLNYLKKIDNPVVVSESVSKMLLEENNYKIGFVRNGIDTEIFNAIDKETIRKKLSLPHNKSIFISVGHLSSRKNPLLIIDSFIRSNLSNQLLVFLGDGNLKQDCIEKINKNENIKIVGKVDNVNEYLAASDYLISASLAEGLPNTVLEAFAVNIPAILSDIPPHVELHQLNEKSSILFETNSSDSLTNAINKTEFNDYGVMQNNCQKIVSNHLDARVMSSNYQEIYKTL